MWEFLSGKKTTIGAALLFVSTVLDQVVSGIWGMDEPWISKTVQTFDWAGMAITGTGLTHKALKKGAKRRN